MTVELEVKYKDGAGFRVVAEDEDQLELLSTYAQKILWPSTKSAMTLEEASKWLGFK